MGNNPLLKDLKLNDMVLIEVPMGNQPPAKQIVKLTKVDFKPSNDEHDLDWLDFDCEVIYTNQKTHPSNLTLSYGNCYTITQLVDEKHLKLLAKAQGLWKPLDFPMTDAELEWGRKRVTMMMGDMKFVK
jgi:hypothetical protein